MNKNVVIIGAGQTGRGYLNRLFALSNQKVTFIDKDDVLIHALNKQKKYTIDFGNQGRESIIIDNFDAYSIENPKAVEALADTTYVFTSVGEKNLVDLIPLIKNSLKSRGDNPLYIITGENGVAPKVKLIQLTQDKRVHLSESVIFCTTITKENSLDILSEDLDFLPYDIKFLPNPLNYHGMVAEENFKDLLERKIYTYNCLSACSAYLGYVKGIENYAQAGNDIEVDKYLHKIATSINEAIAKEYYVDIQKQTEFSQMAIKKFQNKEIVDTVERNVRDVDRKLGDHERIIAPLMLLTKYHLESKELLFVAASALYYGIETDTLIKDEDIYEHYFGMLSSLWINEIKEDIKYLEKHKDSKDLRLP